MKISLSFLLTFLSLSLSATTFVPVPLKQMIKASSAMVDGVVLFSRSEKLANGEVVTITSIELDKWSEELPSSQVVEVYTPGGSFEDETVLFEGAPKFKEGEKVFLFLKEHNSHFWISNLSLGTYRYKNLGSKQMLVNSVFPYHHDIGQISPKDMIELAKKVKNTDFHSKRRDKYQVMREGRKRKSSPHKNSREVASVIAQDSKHDHNNSYWLLSILAIFGALWSFKKQRE